MKNASIRIDARRREISADGRSTLLQEKSWQVLALLLDNAPQVVGRKYIIDAVWAGNYLTGDKGLNQALWSIRAALDDDVRYPQFIRTVPRVGYQWIFAGSVSNIEPALHSLWPTIGRAASIAMLVTMTSSVAHFGQGAPDNRAEVPQHSPDSYATNAYLIDRGIAVEMSDGCKRVLMSGGNSKFGQPVLSEDGAHIAFAIRKDSDCRLITLELSNGTRRNYGACPADVI